MTSGTRPPGGRPDDATLTACLENWLPGRLPGTGRVRVGPLEKPGSGLSAGTLLFSAHRGGTDQATTHDLVVRIPPPEAEALFPRADLARELSFQTTLSEAGIPVAPVVGLELDPSFPGAPFLVTRRVPGRVVDSNDPYLASGWLHDSSPGFQSDLANGFMSTLADIHHVSPDCLDLAGVHRAQPGIDEALGRWTGYLAWAGEQNAPDALHEAFGWCSDNRPAVDPPSSLLWGDAQLANAVFADDGSTAAVLDFELAGAGPAELDLGWFFCLHDMTVERCAEDLPGFADRGALMERYEERTGRRIADLRWYEVFAAVCTASILVRMSSLLCNKGIDAAWLARSNPALDYLAARLR